MNRRAKWIVGAIVLIALGGTAVAWLQRMIDARVVHELRIVSEDIEQNLGLVTAHTVVMGHDTEHGVSLRTLQIRTALLRRDCRGDWTFGFGARVEARGLTVPLHPVAGDMELTSEGTCFDFRLKGALTSPALTMNQGAKLVFDGPCAPEISDGSLRWIPKKQLDIAVSINDGGRCLKSLALLAPTYPEGLIPHHLHAQFQSRFVDLRQPHLQGHTPVSFIADISRRLQGSDTLLKLELTGDGGQQIATCARMTTGVESTTFELGLAMPEGALRPLVTPLLAQDNGKVLHDLRSNEATCDGQGSGLLFTSDLKEVRHQGTVLAHRPTVDRNQTGLQSETCEEDTSCRFDWAVVEFDEEGQLVNKSSLETLVKSLKSQSPDGTLLVNFVHGWRHSGHPQDGNLHDFRRLLRRLALLEKRRESPRQVVGLFFAWPGRLYDSMSANKLATFWNRLEVARRLGSAQGELGPALDALAASLESHHPRQRDNVMVTLAHSMGADALLSVLIDHGDKALGDQIILLNPASSVRRYRRLHADQETSLAIYGSVSDQVNQQLYPLGEALTFDGDDRAHLAAHTTTITNDPTLITHRLDRHDNEPVLCAHEATHALAASCTGVPLSAGRLPPHRVVAVSRQVIPGHADFLSPTMTEHLVTLIASER